MNRNLPGIAGFINLFFLTLVACNKPAEKSSSTAASTSKSTEKKTTAPASRTIISASGAPGVEREILALVNEHRQSRRLPPLTNNQHMEYQARRHAMDMATNRVAFGHQGMSFRMKYIQEKVPGVNDVGENVAYGNLTAKAVVAGWLKSPGHKKNIEGNYKYSGVGVARNQKNQLYFTQIFAR